MKPLERIFFQACIMRFKSGLSVRNVIGIFVALGFPKKRLWYYLDKWLYKGFYTCGVTEDLGWFESDKLTGEYKVMYESIVKGGVQE